MYLHKVERRLKVSVQTSDLKVFVSCSDFLFWCWQAVDKLQTWGHLKHMPHWHWRHAFGYSCTYFVCSRCWHFDNSEVDHYPISFLSLFTWIRVDRYEIWNTSTVSLVRAMTSSGVGARVLDKSNPEFFCRQVERTIFYLNLFSPWQFLALPGALKMLIHLLFVCPSMLNLSRL